MMWLAANVIDHLKGLGSFRGRESPRHFWPYAGGVMILSFIAMGAVMAGPMAEAMRRMREFAAANPGKARIESGPGRYSISVEGHHPEFFAGFADMMIAMNIVIAVAAILLAAAVTRRLHDGGRTGLWGLMPLPFIAFGSVVVARAMTSPSPDSLFHRLFQQRVLHCVACPAGCHACPS